MTALPAPEVPEAATTTASGSAMPLVRREEREGHGGRVAPRHGDPLHPGERGPRARQLGQPVGPGPGVRGPVEGFPVPGVLQPEVGPHVHDEDIVPELLGDGGGLPVRQREEDHVVVGERLGGGGLQHPVRQGPQVRLERPEGLPGVGVPGQRADLDAGVRQQQTEQLPARRIRSPLPLLLVPPSVNPPDRWHDYTHACSFMQRSVGRSPVAEGKTGWAGRRRVAGWRGDTGLRSWRPELGRCEPRPASPRRGGAGGHGALPRTCPVCAHPPGHPLRRPRDERVEPRGGAVLGRRHVVRPGRPVRAVDPRLALGSRRGGLRRRTGRALVLSARFGHDTGRDAGPGGGGSAGVARVAGVPGPLLRHVPARTGRRRRAAHPVGTHGEKPHPARRRPHRVRQRLVRALPSGAHLVPRPPGCRARCGRGPGRPGDRRPVPQLDRSQDPGGRRHRGAAGALPG